MRTFWNCSGPRIGDYNCWTTGKGSKGDKSWLRLHSFCSLWHQYKVTIFSSNLIKLSLFIIQGYPHRIRLQRRLYAVFLYSYSCQIIVPGILVPGILVPGILVPGILVPGILVLGILVPGILVTGILVPGMLVPGPKISQKQNLEDTECPRKHDH